VVLARARQALRDRFFAFFERASVTDDGRRIAARCLDGLTDRRLMPVDAPPESPYPELGRAARVEDGGTAAPIFITARFRSGSTLLWNLFRHVDGCTAYYEPENERRWFDPAVRGTRVDATHQGVEDYWREYEGMEDLGRYFHAEWTVNRLYMDGDAWDPDLRRYLSELIARARGRAVLQFNRMDFRLPWLRAHFPEARVVHLVRHPRDQWCSALVDPGRVPRDVETRDFGPHDHFYLLSWARDLKYQFPFLDERTEPHPYRLFYYLWKLSYLYGITYADRSVRFEDLTADADGQIAGMMAAVGQVAYDAARLRALVQRVPPRWDRFAPDSWYRAHEEACEATLQGFLSARGLLADGRRTGGARPGAPTV
jgi:hypothetical protein